LPELKIKDFPELVDGLQTALVHDYKLFGGLSTKVPVHPHRRAFVRAFFAWVEATIFIFKQNILIYDDRRSALSPSELLALAEKTWDVRDKGDVSIQPRFIPLPNNVRFTVRIVAKGHGIPLDVDFGSRGWQAFRDAVAIRNRITHPKSPRALLISKRELRTLFRAEEWFTALCRDLSDLWIRALKRDLAAHTRKGRRAARLRQELNELLTLRNGTVV
jgi:hypothetical protein